MLVCFTPSSSETRSRKLNPLVRDPLRGAPVLVTQAPSATANSYSGESRVPPARPEGITKRPLSIMYRAVSMASVRVPA